MINLTANAANELKRQMTAREAEGQYVRIGVDTGGCSGMKYTVDFTAEANADDAVFEQDDVKVVCDSISLVTLNGLVVDYVDALVGGGFKFENPNAARSCGCGTSFQVQGAKAGPGAGNC
jgi:iron-sulfur cluster assembly protein